MTDNKQDPLSDDYVNSVIHQHGYMSPEAVIARLDQWIGKNGGENATSLLMYEARGTISKLRGAGEPLFYLDPAVLDEKGELGAHVQTALTWSRKSRAGWTLAVYAAPQASAEARLVFPAHLRKMWSGGEVQAWLDEQLGTTAPKATAKGSLDRYRKWQAEQAKARDDGIEAAAAWVDKRRHNFDHENGRMERDTGAWSFGRGAAAIAMEEYSAELAEIAEGLRALKSAPAAEGVDFPSDLPGQLREYASNNGYSHQDYADTMRQAADALDRQQRGGDVGNDEHATFVIFTQPGKVPQRKGPYPTTKFVEEALREIQAAYPDATSMVIQMPNICHPQSGVEWIDMYGDKRKGRLVSALAAQKPVERDAHKLMAEEYQAWIDCYHSGGDYTDFLAKRLSDIAQQGKEG
ncbi:hypothetical protein BOTU111921_10595 [Bordetella tumbae]|uniref:hypothetical protein n=1 Tax=Bordetella tumbae TaxID=1649139 RepID=UPI0039F0CDCE